MNNEEECSICGIDLKDKYQYKLPCNHTFHYECLLKTFVSLNKDTYKYNNNCPYCRDKCGYLPIVNGLTKIKVGIHVSKKEEITYNCNHISCQAILQRGKNKGNQCNSMANYLNGEFCGKHSKQH